MKLYLTKDDAKVARLLQEQWEWIKEEITEICRNMVNENTGPILDFFEKHERDNDQQ